MPDMYRSPSLEIYGSNPYFEDSLNARIPVKGTMPRGHIAFDYVNTVEDYIAAGNDLLNPLEISEDNLESGKKFANLVKNSTTHIIIGSGHMIMIEKAFEMREKILEFLNK